MRRTIDWDGEAITVIDQCALPGQYRILRLDTLDALIDAIQGLAVRGAPALGAAGVLGVALAARRHPHDPDAVGLDAERVATARPTAVNLRWGVEHGLAWLPAGADAVSEAAHKVLNDDERTNRRLSERAADVIVTRCSSKRLRILTICNSGALAAVCWGTGLGTGRALAERGAVAHYREGAGCCHSDSRTGERPSNGRHQCSLLRYQSIVDRIPSSNAI